MEVVDDKAVVKEYFNNTGFDRWQRIYGDGEVDRLNVLLLNGLTVIIGLVKAIKQFGH